MESCDNGSRAVLKTVGPQGLGGSSPSLSAIWCYSLRVRTPPFHGGDPGSNPGSTTICFHGEIGYRNSLLSCGLQVRVLLETPYGVVAELVHAPALHAGLCGFESHQLHQLFRAVAQLVRAPL